MGRRRGVPPSSEQPVRGREAAAQSFLNLLFIVVDEQRYDTLTAYGNDRIRMPNLNRLARQSLVFDRAYCCQAVCGPSRSSLLTGTWLHWNGETENRNKMRDDIPCLLRLISRGNYLKGFLGRIGHLNNSRVTCPAMRTSTSTSTGRHWSISRNTARHPWVASATVNLTGCCCRKTYVDRSTWPNGLNGFWTASKTVHSYFSVRFTSRTRPTTDRSIICTLPRK